MASTLSYTYTGSYSSSTRSITAWIRYTFTADYSDTQSRLIIHSMGVRNNSSTAMEWGTSSTNGPKYLSVTPAGKSQYKISRDSTDIKWAAGNYDYFNFVTTGRNSAITAWDANTATTYYFDKGTSAASVKLTGHVYKKGAWAVNADFSTTLTVPAKKYTISYSANGGSGAPASQKKIHGTAITLSATVPTRSGYDFLGWSTSSSATVPSYRYGPSHSTGTSFSTNANTTLYAVWHASFKAPTIKSLRAYRTASDASGYNPATKSSGTKGYVDFVYTAPSNYNTVTLTIKFGSTSVTPSSSSSYRYAYATSSIPLTSAVSVTATVSGTKYTYTVNGTTYGGGAFSVSAGTFISKEAYIWDAFKKITTVNNEEVEYSSFAVGQLARESQTQYSNEEPVGTDGDMDVFFRATFMNDVLINVNQNAASGVDYEIMTALTALGWKSSVIQ